MSIFSYSLAGSFFNAAGLKIVSTPFCLAIFAAAFCVSRQGVESALIDKNSLELYIAKEQSDLLH